MLVTGHTGFKGAWLIQLLIHLEIPTIGYSLKPEKDSLYQSASLTGLIPERFADIRDREALQSFVDEHKPSSILHMAAQPLVLKSYKEPEETFSVNVMGTASILDLAFKVSSVTRVGIVTTDKVYKNENQGRRFKENDTLGGKDPYSASKVGTESVVAAWQQIQKFSGGPKTIALRAGNVIGGGDFASDRIVPDLVRARVSSNNIVLRNPESTRPWQHALDPLLGYLSTLDKIEEVSKVAGALNFGPNSESLSVEVLVDTFNKIWNKYPIQKVIETDLQKELEAKSLELDSTLAEKLTGWRPRMDQIEAIECTARWWDDVLTQRLSPSQACQRDIRDFINL